MKNYDVIIIGGGAAGFFTAINIAERNPKLKIAILERGAAVLEKVRISGGGRCNVAHACFEPNALVKHYPRGEKELRGPFHKFSSGDTSEWFEKRGVALKTEADGRMFPVSDSSQTIIDCFMDAVRKLGISVLTGQSVQRVFKSDGHWKIDTHSGQFICSKLVFASGSNPKMWDLLGGLGHSVVSPVPSLFTFNTQDARIKDLPGVSAMASVEVRNTGLAASGPLLVTHWGLSGPAILKLSAWGARILAEKKYRFVISINWLHDIDMPECVAQLKKLRLDEAKRTIAKRSSFGLPSRLWEQLVMAAGITEDAKWADISKAQLQSLANQATACEIDINGKSTFKDEFVTAGGVELKEVDFKTMESKLHQNLYFAGEVLNIDAITGGFNFQNAWTGGFLAAQAIAGSV